MDTKGSVLKPTTPISVRGTVQQQGAGNNATGITLSPLAPFSIRAATIQRPPSVITTTSQYVLRFLMLMKLVSTRLLFGISERRK